MEEHLISQEALNNLLIALRNSQEKFMHDYDKSADDLWVSMSSDDRLKAFYVVCKKIHDGEFNHKGTYRYMLYNIFGFDLDSYALGMECGFMSIHNAICGVDKTEDKWSKNFNEMPNEINVLLCDGNNVFTGYKCHIGGFRSSEGESVSQIEAWMPLPIMPTLGDE